MRLLLFYIFIFSISVSYSQKPFTGKLVYSVEIADTSLRAIFPPSTMTIFTNDTILRIETHTDALGQQTLIRHLEKQKAYLLIEGVSGKYAIQLPEKEEPGEKKYIFKKSKGNKTVSGLVSEKLIVSGPVLKEELDFYFHKKISAKYLPGFENFPGLLTDYYVIATDGLYHHRLVECTVGNVSKDLFGIPSDYKRISMSDFVDLMTGADETIDN